MTKRLRVPVRPRRLLPTEVMTNARRARTTQSERPMVTARVKAMPPVGNGKTARPVTNAAHMATVKTRAAIRAKVIPAAMITARVMSATIAVTTAAPPSAAPLAATMSAHRSASRPHGATTVAQTAATSVGMTAAPWAPATARATPMRAPTCAQRSPHVATRPRLLPRSTTTVACACPS